MKEIITKRHQMLFPNTPFGWRDQNLNLNIKRFRKLIFVRSNYHHKRIFTMTNVKFQFSSGAIFCAKKKRRAHRFGLNRKLCRYVPLNLLKWTTKRPRRHNGKQTNECCGCFIRSARRKFPFAEWI